MTGTDDTFEQMTPVSRARTILIPLVVLVACVAAISALVLTGAVQGDQPRTGPDQAPTTRATVEIAP